METLDLFDARESLERRDEGLARVSETNRPWMERALALIQFMPPMRGAFEVWRVALLKSGIEEPCHVNAWGALARTALKRDIIHLTGDWVAMKAKRSHARRTPEYVSVPQTAQ